jgi:predicted transposase/invertase (TIGR01784 family)
VKTDSIFYRLFNDFPNIFFELIDEPPKEADGYKFSSVEVKQTAFRIDGVFVPIENNESPIYFAEVQFQTDEEIYSRLFSEVHLYLRLKKPTNDWKGVLIFPNRSLDTFNTKHYQESIDCKRVTRIYLNELREALPLPIGIATVMLIIENEDAVIEQARELIERTKQENNFKQQQQLLQLIETILVYKFPMMGREEIEAMFGLSELKQTKVYQEAFEEGVEKEKQRQTLKTVPLLLRLGLTPEQVAQELDLNLEEVERIAQNTQKD